MANEIDIERNLVDCPNGRCVGRSNNNANANGGLVYSNANNASSNSNANDGSRLTNLRSPADMSADAHRHTATADVSATAGDEGHDTTAKADLGLESGNISVASEGAPQANILTDIPFDLPEFEPIAEDIIYPLLNLIPEIISEENLSDSFDYVISHLIHETQRNKYRPKKERYIKQAKKQIGNGTFRIRREAVRNIIVHEGGKTRQVQVTTVFDRFCVHSIMVVVERYCYPSLITNAVASVKGRGTHWLHHRMEDDVNAVPDLCSVYGQTDGEKFYDNIDQDIMMQIIRRYIADEMLLPMLFDFVTLIEKGLSKGLRSSQVYANLLMTPIDYVMVQHCEKYVLVDEEAGTEELRCLYYRYMDDADWFAPSKKRAWELFRIYCEECAKYKVKVKRTYAVRPLSEGFDALGYVMFPCNGSKNGKWCYSRIRKRTKHKFAKRMANVKSRKRRQRLIGSFKGVADHADARHLKKTLIPKKNMPTLSELGLPSYTPKDGKKRFTCQQLHLGDIVNRPIEVLDFETDIKTQNGLRTLVQFRFEGEQTEYKFFTASQEMTFNLHCLRERDLIPSPPLTVVQVTGTGGLRIYKFK